MIRILVLLGLVTYLTTSVIAQDPFHLGIEVQIYPTGLISGIKGTYSINNFDCVYAKIGYNLVRHSDLGVHMDERGGGFGFTLGYDRYLKETFRGFHVGARSDVWFNEINWKDEIGTSNEVSGTSNIVVLQPTLHAGYSWNLNHFIFNPALSFGWEINAKTAGSEVGQGAIMLVGLNILF